MAYRSILAILRKSAQTKPPKFLRARAERELGHCPRCGTPLEIILDQGGIGD